MACGWIYFFKNYQFKSFSSYFCSIELKRQSEHSGLRSDTSSLVNVDALTEKQRLKLVVLEHFAAKLNCSKQKLLRFFRGTGKIMRELTYREVSHN